MEEKQVGIARFDLTGKTAIVTGAGSETGIGYGIARTFAAYGADVVIADLDQAACDDIAQKLIAEHGVSAFGVGLDVRDLAALDALIAKTCTEFGHIDILVNAAGIGITKLAVDVTEEDWDRVLDIDLKGLFFCCQKVAKVMIEQGTGGSIINLSSMVARVVSSRMTPYIAAKAAVAQVTRGMAYEWARFGIRANCICPSYVRTGMTEDVLENPKAFEKITAPVPHPRKMADPLDIGAAALYLACDCSDFVTGSPLYVDGGRTVY